MKVREEMSETTHQPSAHRWMYLCSVLRRLFPREQPLSNLPYFKESTNFMVVSIQRYSFKDWTDWILPAMTKYLCSVHRCGYGCPLTGKLCYIASIFCFQDAYPFFVAFDNDRDGVNFSFAWGLSRKNGLVSTTGLRLTALCLSASV